MNALQTWIHGKPAFRIGKDGLERQEGFSWVSANWTQDTSLKTVRDWLECLLPETIQFRQWLKDGLLPRGMEVESAFIAFPVFPHLDTPGSVLFMAGQESFPLHQAHHLSENDVLDWILLMAPRHRSPQGPPCFRSSLPGQRPKASLVLNPDGTWAEGVLGTHIVKIEDERFNQGEAGVESIVQATLSELGLPAAETLSRILGDEDVQVVVSRRSDRFIVDGVIHRRHQEDLRQVSGCVDKGVVPGHPGWPESHDLLRQWSLDPEPQHDIFIGLAASGWMLGHGDLHRGNLGFHTETTSGNGKHVTVAPAYDFSSGEGSRYGTNAILPIGQQHMAGRVTARTWAGHARLCGLEPDRVLDRIRQVAEQLPDAFTTARRRRRELDDNRCQEVVDRRCDRIEARLVAYARRFLAGLESSHSTMKGRDFSPSP